MPTFVPSQKQLKWSHVRVGLTVVFASITLGVLIFLMSGTGGVFTKKIKLISYFDNSGGLRVGAPVRLEGVDIGNVQSIRLVAGHRDHPVEAVMKVNTKNPSNHGTDPVISLAHARLLGENYIVISRVP